MQFGLDTVLGEIKGFTQCWFISQKTMHSPRVYASIWLCVQCMVLGNACVDSNNSPHSVNERWEQSVILPCQPLSQLRDGNVSLSLFFSKQPNGPTSKSSFFAASKQRYAEVIHTLCKSLCVAYYQLEHNAEIKSNSMTDLWSLLQCTIY